MTENEHRKTKELEDKLKDYRKAVGENGDFLTPKKRDLVIIDVLESTIDMRYLFLEMYNKFTKITDAQGKKNPTIPERAWFLDKVLPGLVQNLINSIIIIFIVLTVLHYTEIF